MKPDVQTVMLKSFERMMTDIAPHLTAEYAMGSAAVIGLMMFQTATEFERAAEIRVQENDALRGIFKDALRVVADDALKVRLEAASSSVDQSLAISALDETNDGLVALLIELQDHIEQLGGDDARQLETKIWDELVRSAEARRLPHPMVG